MRIAFIVFASLALPGCSWFRGACAAALPVIAQAETDGTDALAALQTAESYVQTLQLDAAARAQIEQYIQAAISGVRTGESLLDAAASACSAPDPTVIFKDFIDAWNLLEPLIVGAFARHGLANFPIQVPRVVLLARRLAVAPH
jgi:hypothetical protein